MGVLDLVCILRMSSLVAVGNEIGLQGLFLGVKSRFKGAMLTLERA